MKTNDRGGCFSCCDSNCSKKQLSMKEGVVSSVVKGGGGKCQSRSLLREGELKRRFLNKDMEFGEMTGPTQQDPCSLCLFLLGAEMFCKVSGKFLTAEI